MIKSSGFVRDVIAKHFYAILTSIKFQWIFILSVSELAIQTETRWNVLIDNFSMKGFWIRVSCLNWLEDCFEVCIHKEWNLELILAILKLYE